MKRLILLFCAPFALAGCTGINAEDVATVSAGAADTVGAPAPATVADRTILDEQGMYAVELAYKAARVAVETGVDAGLIKGATAARIATIDNRAYSALGIVRSAYRTGNAASYKNALSEARSAISALLTLTGKEA